MGRARDIANIINSGTFITPANASATYLPQTTASATYIPQNNSMFAGKNKIINGEFDVWQRGTSFTNTANAGYTADRWLTNVGTGGTIVTSQQSFTPGTAPAAGYEAPFFLRLNRSTTGSATSYFSQRIEDVRTFAGQTITLSFWAKASSAYTFDFGDIYAWRVYGTGGSSSESPGTFGAANITTSWQRFTLTLNMPSVSGKTIGASSYLEITYSFPTSKGTFTIDLWGVQVEAGSVATSFVPAGGGSFGDELRLCQRYYETGTFGNNVLTASYVANGYQGGPGFPTNHISFKVTKRVTPHTIPTLTISGMWTAPGSFGVTANTNHTFVPVDASPDNFKFITNRVSGNSTPNAASMYHWESSPWSWNVSAEL
jgi:hypothetical protein